MIVINSIEITKSFLLFAGLVVVRRKTNNKPGLEVCTA